MKPEIIAELRNIKAMRAHIDGKAGFLSDVNTNTSVIVFTKSQETTRIDIVPGNSYCFAFDGPALRKERKVGRIVPPLVNMSGIVEETHNDCIIVSLRGVNEFKGICSHCGLFITEGVLCPRCKQLLLMSEDQTVEDIQWRGQLSRKLVKEVFLI